MSKMNARGCEMLLHGQVIPTTICLGDKVRLIGAIEGIVHQWSKKGVIVQIDTEKYPRLVSRYTSLQIVAFDIGNDEIVEVLESTKP